MANQGQRTAYLQAQRNEMQRWLPELEQLVMLRASRDKEWSLFTNSIQYNQQRELEKLRQQPALQRIELGKQELAAKQAESQRKEALEEASRERWRAASKQAGFIAEAESSTEFGALRQYSVGVAEAINHFAGANEADLTGLMSMFILYVSSESL